MTITSRDPGDFCRGQCRHRHRAAAIPPGCEQGLISGCSGSLSFLDPLRPPAEPCGRADEIAAALEHDAAAGLCLFQFIEIGEMAVDEDAVGEQPEVLGGLQLGGLRWQEEQVDMVGHEQLHARMPPCPIQHQHDLLVGSRAGLLGEGGELGFEDLDAHLRGLVKEGTARGGMDKADQPTPDEAVLHHRMRSRACRRPDATEEWLEANAMLIGRPELNTRVREGRRHLAQERS